MKRISLAALAQIVAGIALVAVAGHLATGWVAGQRAARMPPGRTIIRPPHDVQCLAVVKGAVWAGGKEGVFLFAPDGAALPIPEPLRGLRFVAAILPEADGAVWIAHEDGMTLWRPGSARHFSALGGAFPGRGLAVLRDRDGRLWAGSDRALTRLEGEVFRSVAMPEEMRPREAAVLFQDHTGVLWIGDSSPRSSGLLSLGPQGFRLWTRSDGLPHHAVNTILEQRGGRRLWIGTGFAGSGGAVVVEDGVWRAVGRREGLAGDKVRSIFEDGAGRLWFGSEYDGVAVFGPSRLAVFTEDDGLAGREVKAILEHPAGTFWLGTDGGLSRFARLEGFQSGDRRFPGF